MPINFPTSLDTLANPLATNNTTSPAHHQQHSDANDILEELEKILVGRPWFNVKAYGAVGDGTTDDRAAIQAALDAATGGGVVLIPANWHSKVGSGLTIPASVILRGAGYSSRLDFTSTTVGDDKMLRLGDQNRVEGLRLTDSRSYASNPIQSVAIRSDAKTDLIIRGCTISGFSESGIDIANGGHALIEGNYVHTIGSTTDLDGDAIRLFEVEHVRVVGNNVKAAGKHGLNCYASSPNFAVDITITGNVFNDHGDSGVNLQRTKRITIGDNVCDHNGYNGVPDGGQGIGINEASEDVTVAGNTCTDATEHGIVVQGTCLRVTVSGNVVYDCDWDGIAVKDSCNGVAISGNVSRSNGMNGILVTTTNSNVTLVGNVCNSNGDNGIDFAADGGTISGNLCVGNDVSAADRSGIVLGAASEVAVVGNTCLGATHYMGIRAYAGNHYTVVGNVCREASFAQISGSIETGGGAGYVKASNVET